ncbi:helix-turn-helix transcriptional regulator [Halorubrum saccharovorum]|uniref:helix-turn-helix transcriptional regulator n=1 Tax=Halorubrum saccharovorum TaxID=2248 RepID=UPI001267A576|nr:helix-turn-helix transcriptional regulator [Halorubrum saccharovorum]
MLSGTNLQLVVSVSQAIFSLGLLVVTAVYTYYTRQQSDATENQIDVVESQTKASAKPYLKATIERSGPVVCNFVIQNTGNGAAHNVTASWKIGSESEKREWTIPLLPSNQKHRFHLSDPSGEEILPTERDIKEAYEDLGFNLKFEADCEDIFDESHDFEETIDLEEAIWGREEAAYELLSGQPEETIAEGIESISENFDDIGNVATYLRRELPSIVNAHQAEQELRLLQQFGEMTIEQLSQISSEEQHRVYWKMESLAEDGLVEFDEEDEIVRLPDDKQASTE